VSVHGTAKDITAHKAAERALRANQAQLEAANRELESFAYSVSHDLRAPARRIDGFASILSKEHGAQLDEDARHCIQMISEGARNMGRLIEDLLGFSRLGQQMPAKEPVDMQALARGTFEELASDQAGRKVELKVGDLPPAHADPRLLRQVWANLLSNAFKFTRGRDPAIIEIGHEVRDGAPVYFVRDNGIGFDMRYAQKLFAIFQRLHSGDAFEGTGVGLAIVQRIVTRHGGTVWADARKNEGATFYFTLTPGDARDQRIAAQA
jgi:light-regulated signal transduction histidine kinase (bacteriophytochrome)